MGNQIKVLPGGGPSRRKDKVFSKPAAPADFKFDQKVAAVFDDMVERSVPFYAEMQRQITEIAADFAAEGSNVYDLGCSTGTTLLNLDEVVARQVKFIGVDNSQEMLDRCREKLAAHKVEREFELVCSDLNSGVQIQNASMVLMVLTLQFIRPLHRDNQVQQILRGLNPNGALILVEKVLGDDSLFNRLFIKYYYDMKRRHGYSDMEISQKREALENVLIPYHLEENEALVRRCGFTKFQVWFRWYNFCGMIAVK